VNQDEQQLIRRARAGDTTAFTTLVVQHGPFVYNLALRTLNNSQEAEDIAQETFLRAWQGIGDFQAAAQLRTWLYRITINLCYNRLPGLKADLAALEPDELSSPLEGARPIERGMLTAELREQLYNAVDRLPETYRLLITLHYMDGYRYEEIAEMTQLSPGVVKTGLFRARQQLRRVLMSYEETADG
jgi:RNA polymerase sigma-70 factor (ECF subfamily)